MARGARLGVNNFRFLRATVIRSRCCDRLARGHLSRSREATLRSQKDTPFRAAMVHELHRLLPTLVFEKDNGPVAVLFEVKTYFCADPFLGPSTTCHSTRLAG